MNTIHNFPPSIRISGNSYVLITEWARSMGKLYYKLLVILYNTAANMVSAWLVQSDFFTMRKFNLGKVVIYSLPYFHILLYFKRLRFLIKHERQSRSSPESIVLKNVPKTLATPGPWLVRGACRAGTRAALATRRPNRKYFFRQLTLFQCLCLHHPATLAGDRAGSPVSECVSLVALVGLYKPAAPIGSTKTLIFNLLCFSLTLMLTCLYPACHIKQWDWQHREYQSSVQGKYNTGQARCCLGMAWSQMLGVGGGGGGAGVNLYTLLGPAGQSKSSTPRMFNISIRSRARLYHHLYSCPPVPSRV